MKFQVTKPAKSTAKRKKTSRKVNFDSETLREMLLFAERQGLMAGARTEVLRGRMPVGLVAEAKRRSGITSDSKLLEAALTKITVADDYWEWMRTQHGTISPDLDLEC